VDVEEAGRSRVLLAERVQDAGWCRDEHAGAAAERPVFDLEVELAVEDVEGVGVVVVRVWLGSFERSLDRELDHREAGERALDQRNAAAPCIPQDFPLPGAVDDAVGDPGIL
jgi:hypothetical protein